MPEGLAEASVDVDLTPAGVEPAALLLAAEVHVDPPRGSAVVRVALPITANAGRTPLSVALVHRMDTGRTVFGSGWDLERPPDIAVDASDGIPGFDGSETFLLGSEPLVRWRPEVPGAGGALPERRLDRPGWWVTCFRPRCQPEGQRLRAERWTDTATGVVHWRVRDDSDVVTVYGRRADGTGRITDPETGAVQRWLPELRVASTGDALEYRYRAEDTVGIGSDPADRRHLGRPQPQRHLVAVRSGNDAAATEDGPELPEGAWRIQLVLDYGDHDADQPAPQPDRPWPARSDPFSVARGGFEVRTWRLCRRLLTFHRHAELGPDPVLVHETQLGYDEDRGLTRLRSVTAIGVADAAAGGRVRRPPMTFEYSDAGVPGAWQVLANALAAGLGPDRGQLVDLRQNGRPGVLADVGGELLFAANLGGGVLGPMQALPRAITPGRVASLGDVDRDGRADALTLQPRLAGMASYVAPGPAGATAGEWSPHRPFRQSPVLDARAAGFLDLDGVGRPAPVQRGAGAVHAYRPGPNDHDGYRQSAVAPAAGRDSTTAPMVDDPTRGLFLVDLTGDGVLDQLVVRPASIHYWPGRGRGRFGSPVSMADPPDLARGGVFDPRRLRFADLSGTGTTDLIRLGDGSFTWWENLAGNAFGPAREVSGLPPVDARADVQIADVLGDGRPCLVWSAPMPVSGEPVRFRVLRGHPGRLSAVANGAGGRTELTYGDAGAHAREDAAAGRAWRRETPGFVPVVDRLRVVDAITGTAAVSEFSYHDGVYDSEGHRFGCFGCVDRLDRETIGDEVLMAGLHRTWFVTPLGHDVGPVDAWTGDPEARMPAPAVRAVPAAATGAAPLPLTPAEAADARRCVVGRPLREEVFDVGLEGQAAANPLRVLERGYEVSRLQPAVDDESAAFAAHEATLVTRVYEGASTDPRVTQDVALELDAWGRTTLQCTVAYPRRVPAVTAQGQAHVVVLRQRFAAVDTAGRFVGGVPVRSERFQAASAGFGQRPRAVAEIADSVSVALSNPVPPADPLPAAPAVRLVGVERVFYRDGTANPAAEGVIGLPVLVHHEEQACFDEALLAAGLGTRALGVDLGVLGYRQDGGLWWRRDEERRYAPAARLHRPVGTLRWDGAVSSIDWDAGLLRPVRVVDAALNETTAELEPRLMLYRRSTDPNGTVVEAGLDALGALRVSSTYGTIAVPAGGVPVPYGHAPLAEYTPPSDLNPGALLADPEGSCGRIAQASAHDLGRWSTQGRPAQIVTLSREDFPAGSPVRVRVAYLDGFGRPLQERVRVEAGPAIVRTAGGAVALGPDGAPTLAHSAVRWVVSERVTPTLAGRTALAHDGYFSPVPEFEADAVLAELGGARRIRLDALGREVRVDESDGTLTRTEEKAWQTLHWDPLDTVADSRYRLERAGLPVDDPERVALDASLAWAGTPAVQDLDPLGRPVRQTDPTGYGDRVTGVRLDAEGRPELITDGRGLPTFVALWDLAGRRLTSGGPDAGREWSLPDAADRPVHAWDARGVHVRRTFDRLDRLLSTTLEEAGASVLVEEVRYGDAPGVARPGRNSRGRMILARDAAGEVTVEGYDPFGNPLARARVFHEGDGTPDWAAAPPLGTQAYETRTRWDAFARPVSSLGPDGARRDTTYLPSGGVGRITWSPADNPADTVVVLSDVVLDARGLRTSHRLGNGVVVERAHHPENGRTTSLTATLRAGAAGPASPRRVFQDLRYTYDAAGNVVRVLDAAQEPANATALLRGATASTVRVFGYDAVHQLRTATGRAHSAVTVDGPQPRPLLALNDGQAVERYTETFDYDLTGNLTSLRHVGATRSWTNDFWVSPSSNRSLPAAEAAAGSPEARFDANGQLRSMPHLPSLEWDGLGRLRRVTIVDRGPAGTADDQVHQYDDEGRRLRTRVRRVVAGLVEETETVTVDGSEIRRIRLGGQTILERRSSLLAVDDDVLATVRVWTIDSQGREAAAGDRRVTYPLHDRLGSAVLELDGTARVVAYEDYLPYGGTAFRAGDQAREVAVREYRFAGRHTDEATGLVLAGVRYYAPWTGRWLSPDPLGPVDSLNLFAYAAGSPTTLADPEGLAAVKGKAPPTAPPLSPGDQVRAFVRGLPPDVRAQAERALQGMRVGPGMQIRVDVQEDVSATGEARRSIRVQVDEGPVEPTGPPEQPMLRPPPPRGPDPSHRGGGTGGGRPGRDGDPATPAPPSTGSQPGTAAQGTAPTADPSVTPPAGSSSSTAGTSTTDPDPVDPSEESAPLADLELPDAPTELDPDTTPLPLVGSIESGFLPDLPDLPEQEPMGPSDLREEFLTGFADAALDLLAGLAMSQAKRLLYGPAADVESLLDLGDAMGKAYREEGGGGYGVLGAVNVLNPMYHLMTAGYEANEAAGRALTRQEAGDYAGAAAAARESGANMFHASKAAVDLGGFVAGTAMMAGKFFNKPGITAGQVGSYDELTALERSWDGLDKHHMTQAKAGHSGYGEGITMALPHDEHVLTRTYGSKGKVVAAAEKGLHFRQKLARDLRDIRRIAKGKYGKGSHYNPSLQEVIRRWQQDFPTVIKKPPRPPKTTVLF